MPRVIKPKHKAIEFPKALPIFHEIDNASDRAAAIVAVSFVENNLALVLLAWLRPLEVAEQKELFDGKNALLNTLDSKIQLADALGIVFGNAFEDLRRLKKIRNAFAHQMEVRSFDNQAIAPHCENLMYPKFLAWAQGKKAITSHREMFVETAHHFASRFDLEAKLLKPPSKPNAISYDTWVPA